MGVAVLKGLQGDSLSGPESVVGCAKHFAGDGATEGGVDQANTVAVAIALSRDVHEVWLPLGDVQVGAGSERRGAAAVENLITGERYPLEWGGIRVRIDPVRAPAVLFRCLA